MAGVDRFEICQGLGPAQFADDDPVGAHAEGGLQEGVAAALGAGTAVGQEGDRVRLAGEELEGVLDGDQPFLVEPTHGLLEGALAVDPVGGQFGNLEAAEHDLLVVQAIQLDQRLFFGGQAEVVRYRLAILGLPVPGHEDGDELARGGSQSVRYFLSGNYENEEGIIWYNSDETFRLRGNIGIVFNENFSLDVSTGYVDGFTRFMGPTRSDGGVWQDLLWSNGHFLDRVNPFDGSGPGTANPRLGGFQEHLPSDVGEVQATRDYSRFTGSATLNFTSGEMDLYGIPTTITQRAVVGVDKAWDVDRQLFPLEDGNVPANLQQYPPYASGSSWAAVYSETVDGQMFYERPIQGNMSFGGTLDLAGEDSDEHRKAASYLASIADGDLLIAGGERLLEGRAILQTFHHSLVDSEDLRRVAEIENQDQLLHHAENLAAT